MTTTELGPPKIPVNNPGTAEEGTFQSSKDQLTMYLKRWEPSSATMSSTPPRALVVFVHGFIEHYGRYDNAFPLFAQSNIAVTAFDQRGFGRTWTKHATPKKHHGDTTWKQQFEDIEDLIRLERSRLDGKFGKDKVPIYLMGHSMGGGLTYAFFSRPPGSKEGPTAEAKDMVRGAICSSPWAGLTKPPAPLLVKTLNFLLKYFPNMPYYAAVNIKEISHDEDVQKWTAADPLVDGHVLLKCLPNPLEGGVRLVTEDYKYWPEDLPLLIVHGDADPVTSYESSKELVEKTKATDKEHKGFEGLLHECWHEKGDSKIIFINYIIDWIKARTPETA